MVSRAVRLLLRHHESSADLMWSASRIGFLPALALLGVALPIVFLSWIERYLYYLRPLELIPTYGTAWLLIAASATPFSLLCSVALQTFDSLADFRRVHRGLVVSLLGVAAAAIVAALAYAALLWLRTFGLL